LSIEDRRAAEWASCQWLSWRASDPQQCRPCRNELFAAPFAISRTGWHRLIEAEPMLKMAYFLLMIAAFSLLAPTQAQTPGKVDQEVVEMALEFIGAPVFAADGAEIGEVADISFDEENQPHRLRIVTGVVLGLGERVLEIPKGTFTALRGAVVLDLPADAVKVLPELNELEDEK
jgi:sporulation protein YlmC with PRC-barrel domain